MTQHTVAQSLAAERARTLERLAGVERELAAVIESSGQAGTDDEHDPEGATVAFERQHLAALEAGADPAVVTTWMNEIQAMHAPAEARLPRGEHGHDPDLMRRRERACQTPALASVRSIDVEVDEPP